MKLTISLLILFSTFLTLGQAFELQGGFGSDYDDESFEVTSSLSNIIIHRPVKVQPQNPIFTPLRPRPNNRRVLIPSRNGLGVSGGNHRVGQAMGSGCSRSVSCQECEVVRLVNIERKKRRLRPLTISRQCTGAAKKASARMSRSGRVSHDGFQRRGRTYRLTQTSRNGTMGENVAGGQRSAREVMNGWMRSPGHKKNILSNRFTKIGVSLVINKNKSYKYFWTQCFH